MDSIPKFLASVIAIVIGVLLCVSLIISAVVVNSARTYHSSVIEQIEASAFETATINKCLTAAANDNYTLAIDEISPDDTDSSVGYYKVTLKYKLAAPLFGSLHEGKLVGYALTGARVGDSSGSGENVVVPGLYETGALALYYEGKYEEFASKLITPWTTLVESGTISVTEEGVVNTQYDSGAGENASSSDLCGELFFPTDGSITATAEYSFKGCDELTGVRFPDSLTTIGKQSFSSSSALLRVDLGSGFESSGTYAFAYCCVETVTYPGTLSDWLNLDFTATSSTPLGDDNSIPTNLYLNGELLESAVIPADTTELNKNLAGCSSLRSLLIPDGTAITSIPTSAYWGCKNSDTDDLTDGLRSVFIGEGITTISDYAFSGVDSLKTIYIPSTVTSISKSAFDYCESLDCIVVDSNNTTYTTVDNEALVNSTTGTVEFVSYAISELILPDDGSITAIGNAACYSRSNLTAITIPASVTEIGRSAFNYCRNLKTINYTGTKEEWKAITFGDYWNSNIGTTNVYCSDGIYGL